MSDLVSDLVRYREALKDILANSPQEGHRLAAQALGQEYQSERQPLSADPIDIAEEFVLEAVHGSLNWECRSLSDEGDLSYIEAGTGEHTSRFLSVPLPYLDACKVEYLIDGDYWRDPLLDILDLAVGWCRPGLSDAEKLKLIEEIGTAMISSRNGTDGERNE